MPMQLETVGEAYFYEAGYCLRDALAQGLGDDHPLVIAIAALGPGLTMQGPVFSLVMDHGFRSWLHDTPTPPPDAIFPIGYGHPTVLFYRWGPHGDGHAAFTRNPRWSIGRLAADEELIGWIHLDRSMAVGE